jgi:hypothetical protein
MFMSVFTQKKACIGETLEPSKNTKHENFFDSGMPWIRREEKEATSLGGKFQRPKRDRRLGKMSSKRADAWSASDAVTVALCSSGAQSNSLMTQAHDLFVTGSRLLQRLQVELAQSAQQRQSEASAPTDD